MLDKEFEDVPGFENFKAEGKTLNYFVKSIRQFREAGMRE